MPAPPTPSRRRAIAITAEGHDNVAALIACLPRRALTTPGLGGGEWSPKDLVGHLASWEEHAFEAIDAWSHDRAPAIDKELWSTSTSAVNARAVARAARLSFPEVVRRADATHRALLAQLEGMSDARWRRPGTSRGRTSVGHRLGGILGGPAGPFRHAEAHMKDLEAFVAEHAPAG